MMQGAFLNVLMLCNWPILTSGHSKMQLLNNHGLFYEMIKDIQKLHFRMTGGQNSPVTKRKRAWDRMSIAKHAWIDWLDRKTCWHTCVVIYPVQKRLIQSCFEGKCHIILTVVCPSVPTTLETNQIWNITGFPSAKRLGNTTKYRLETNR